MFSLWQVLQLLDKPCVWSDKPLKRYVLDSREVREGDVFLAVQGQYADGHHYIEEAYTRGAALVLGTQDYATSQCYIQCDDVQAAITLLAKAWRAQYTGYVIAITGTVGKTSTKEMLYTVLQQYAGCGRSLGNYNNEWGVPLSILNMPTDVPYIIVELGAKHPGDIASLMAWLHADYGIITKVGIGHTLSMGDQYGVAACKYEIIENLKKEGVAVVHQADCMYFKQPPRTPAIIIGRDVVLSDVVMDWQKGSAVCSFHFTDIHHVMREDVFTIELYESGYAALENAAVVAAVCGSLGISAAVIQQGLQLYKHYTGRGKKFLWRDCWVVDETYNANPTSMKASIDNILLAEGPRLVVLGDMLELGADEVRHHREIIEYIQKLDIDVLIVVGKHMRDAAQYWNKILYYDVDQHMMKDIIMLHNIRCVMLKGSHSMALGTWVDALRRESDI